MFDKNSKSFLIRYFGSDYLNYIDSENLKQVASIHSDIQYLRKKLETISNRMASDRSYLGSEATEDLCILLSQHFEENDFNISFSEDVILSDLRKHKLPLTQLAPICHQRNIEAGWWHDVKTDEPLKRDRKELISLIASEIFEVLEGERKDSQDKHLPERKASEVEAADFLIRVFDYCGKYKVDFIGPFLMECVETSFMDTFSSLDDYVSHNMDKYNALVDKANNKGIPVTVDMLGQLEAYQSFCYQKTKIAGENGIGNRFVSLLKISNAVSRISDLELSFDNTVMTFDDRREFEFISEAFAMMLDYCAHCGYDVVSAIIEKMIYNIDRQDHNKESRLKANGKKI